MNLPKYIFAVLNLTAAPLMASGGHALYGADYGEEGSNAYTASPSSFDRDKLLNPHFLPFLEDVKDMVILDAGCGPGHFSIYAAQHGGTVFGFDINETMIHSGTNEVHNKKLSDKVFLNVGDVKFLPYRDNMFDRALSINVAPNLPSSSVKLHFQELSRTLKTGGKAVITVPISLEVIFTNGVKQEKESLDEIKAVLDQLPENPTSSQIYSSLISLHSVVNATFAIENKRLVLVTNLDQLKPGQEIWRKLPVLVVPNYYHPESEYIEALKEAGLTIEKIQKPHFSDQKELADYNSEHSPETQFGPAYVPQGPYALFWVKK